MAKAPTPGAARADAAISIGVNGKTYTLRPSELSARDAAALRKETGTTVRAMLEAATADPDIDVIAAIVWLSRRQHGDDVSFDEIAGEITYASTIDGDVPAAEEDENSPEA